PRIGDRPRRRSAMVAPRPDARERGRRDNPGDPHPQPGHGARDSVLAKADPQTGLRTVRLAAATAREQELLLFIIQLATADDARRHHLCAPSPRAGPT